MPVLKLFTEVVNKKNQVVVSGSNLKVAAEIQKQLHNYSHIECVNIAGNYDMLSEVSNLSTLIHFAGFSPQTLADTLDHTTILHRLLQTTSSYKGKFVLVLPNIHTHLYHVAVSLTSQYAKVNQLNYQIVETSPGADPEETATEILKKIIYKYQKPKTEILKNKPTETVEQPKEPNQIPLRKHRSLKLSINPLKILLSVLILVSVPYLIAVVGFLALVFGSKCVVKSQMNSLSCINIGYYGARLNSILSRHLPGSLDLSVSAGFPPLESFSVFENLKTSHENLQLAKKNATEIVKNIQTGEPISKNGSMLVSNLMQLSEDLARLQTDLRSWYANTSTPPKDLAEAAIMVGDSRELISQIQSVVANYSDFFPPDRKINYAVLVVDNSELRSGGGLISSAVIFSINQGKLETPQTFSINDESSNFVGEVEAPADFQAITGSKNWLFRDSNWDPDFSNAAKQAAWFLEKESGQKIDVVLSVNLNTLAKLSFLVPDFSFDSQKITSENFHKLYLSSLAKNSYTSQFIKQYTDLLVKELTRTSNANIEKTLPVIIDELASNNILIVPVTFSLSGTGITNWDGSISPQACRSQLECAQQYLYFFDTNLSANKTDSYVKKSADINVTIEPGLITNTAKISYENTSQPGVWPGGNYKNYLRIYTLKDSKLSSIKINGTPVPQNRYAVTQYNNLNQTSLLFEVPAGGKTDIEIQTQYISNTQSKFHFQFDLQPQPGQSNIPSQLTINYPETWFSTVFANKSKISPSVASPGLLRYNPDLSRKVQIDIDLAPAQSTQP